MKILKLIVLFTLFGTLYSCHDDESLIKNDTKSYHLKTSRLSINQVINEISNKEIKQKLQITNLSTSPNISLLRSNDSLDYFIKKEKDDELTTYLLNLNSYSQLKPYFLKLIITKNKNETEKMGFLKYIPTSPVSSLDMATFTGKIEILDTNLEINATSEYVNGVKQISNQSNGASNRMVCVDELLITEVKCSRDGNHGVGGICFEHTNPTPSDAYYVVSLFTRCNTDRTIPTQIIEDTGNPNGGTSSFSNTAYLYSFVDSLSQEELAIYVTNPSIQDYLVSNLIIDTIPNCDPVLGGDCTQVIIDPQAEQFVNELLDLAIENNATFNFDNTIDSSNTLVFNTIQDFENHLETNLATLEETDFEIDAQNQRTATAKFSYGTFGITIKVKQNMLPTYEVVNVSSVKTGLSILLSYEQTDYNVDVVGSYVNVDVEGLATTGIKITVPFEANITFEDEVHFRVVIDKNTGHLITAYEIND